MPAKTFMVRMQPDRNWRPGEPPWRQSYWLEHGAFIDALQADGTLYMAGILADLSATFLVLDADDKAALQARLEQDPWVIQGLLRIASIDEWLVLMDPRVNYKSKVPR